MVQAHTLTRLLPAALVTGLLVYATPRAQPSNGFVPLFDGTLNGWIVENTQAGNFKLAGDVLHVEGPTGWIRSARRYEDFSLRVEFRFMTPDADSGIFLRAAGDTQFLRGWPNQSYQVQVRNPSTPSKFPPVGGLFRHGMPPGDATLDEQVVNRLFRGTGVWQILDIELIADRLNVRLDGSEVLRADGMSRTSGYIGMQGEAGVVDVPGHSDPRDSLARSVTREESEQHFRHRLRVLDNDHVPTAGNRTAFGSGNAGTDGLADQPIPGTRQRSVQDQCRDPQRIQLIAGDVGRRDRKGWPRRG